MSLVIHEAYSFDSQELELFWWDDFLGDSIADEWRGMGTGSASLVDQQTGGIIRFTTGATNLDSLTMDWNNIRSLLVTKRVAMESRLKLAQTDHHTIRIYLRFDWDNHIRFENNNGGAGAAKWYIVCRDAAAQTSQDSCVTADTDYHRYRIVCEVEGGNHVHFYIDGVQCDNSPITTNVPDDAADYLQPFFWIETRENATKSMDLDYVGVRQLI